MSKEKRRVPKLRFPGFTEDWEQRKLSDISTKVTTKNVDVHYTETLTNSAEQGIISQVDFFDKEISNKDNINGYYIVDNNDFIYNPRISTLAPVGPINRNKLNRTGIMSPLYTVFRSSNVDLGFLEWYFQSSHWHRYMKLNGDSGARADRIAIKDSTFFEMPIKIPVNIKEQVLIGEILEKFNQYITLHQRKLDNLKLKKKALLQKLFPKNGERYPELRFPGFTDTWEQRKLGECMNSFAYGLNAAAKEYDGMHKYIRITDIDDETHNFIQSNLTSPDIDFNMDVSDYKLNVGDIVFARTGASVGKTYLYNPNDGDLYYAGFLIRGKVKEDCDAGFIYQNTLTKDYDSFIKITSQRSGQPGVNSKEYATFRLNIPCKDEQEQISKVLNSLDELFTLHQRKLDHLKLQKKALLQQMFV